jgi:hypothetical protein
MTAKIVDTVILAYVKDGLWEQAERDLLRLKEQGTILEPQYQQMLADVRGSQAHFTEYARRYRAAAGS